MIHAILMAGLLGLPLSVQAEDLVLNDLTSKGGVQLSVEELKQLMPNAKVASHLEDSTRRWTNEPEGKFVASSDSRRHSLAGGKSHTAQGTWHVGDNGTYCVTLE